ncbi:hypothetical protein Ahy_B01g055481 [Arachis hypogaea]|uniref:RNase H type-1 domain-containing protein n=1 Tax=Arachis hypogaea TaxID=3818 RepID=A0A445AWC2_ARAHY|nr:hypothetical protein Ahy_B01g055481 [Arachis hypogaea]
MHVELWGIVRSLQIVVVNNITSLVVESDSIPTLNFTKKGHHSSHPCAPFLKTLLSLPAVCHISLGPTISEKQTLLSTTLPRRAMIFPLAFISLKLLPWIQL